MNYKKMIIRLIILFAFCNTISAQISNITIEGQIIGFKGGPTIRYSLNDYFDGSLNETTQIDSLGRFNIVKPIGKTQLFHLIYTQGDTIHTCKLIVQPGSNYTIFSIGISLNNKLHYTPEIYSYNASNDYNNISFRLDQGQMLFNLIDNGTFGSLYHDDWNLLEPDSLLPTLKDRIYRQLSQFEKLLENGLISKQFYEIAKLNIEYTLAYRLAVTISDTWYMKKFHIPDSTINKRLLSIYPKVFELYPVNKSINFEKQPYFQRYIDLYLEFSYDSQSGSYKPNTKKGAAATERLLNSEPYLNEIAYKIYHQEKIMSYLYSFGPNSVKLAKDMLKKQGGFDQRTEFVINNVLIPRAEAFAVYTNKEIPEGVIILNEDDSINSMKSLRSLIKGRPAIIDLWGTWCPPCRYQLQFKDSINNVVSKYDIAMVYIAFEYGNKKENWLAMTKGFKLKGYNFIANRSFQNDLKKEIGDIEMFPRYLIMDKTGKIIEKNAIYPSKYKELEDQINNLLKD